MIHLDRGTLRIGKKEGGLAKDIPFRAGEVRFVNQFVCEDAR